MTEPVGALHLACTTMMAGVIWFVQLVHYPLMSAVGRERFAEYEAGHTSRTGWVVIPLMLCELATALWLAISASGGRSPAFVGLGLLAVIWISTAALQVPAHTRLSKGFDPAVHRRLVRTNWLRTVAWSARVPVAFVLAS